MDRNLANYKPAFLIVLGLAFGLFLSGQAVAAESFSVGCRVGNGRSSIQVRHAGSSGGLFVQLFSGEESITSSPKATSKKKVVEFKFDSDPAYLAENPDVTEGIEPSFIKKREITVVIRKANSNLTVGAVRAKCKIWRKPKTAPL